MSAHQGQVSTGPWFPHKVVQKLWIWSLTAGVQILALPLPLDVTLGRVPSSCLSFLTCEENGITYSKNRED